jgi:hypothetical protein
MVAREDAIIMLISGNKQCLYYRAELQQFGRWSNCILVFLLNLKGCITRWIGLFCIWKDRYMPGYATRLLSFLSLMCNRAINVLVYLVVNAKRSWLNSVSWVYYVNFSFLLIDQKG